MTTVQRLELDVVDDPSILLRVVSTCHQRGFRIAALSYERLPGGGRVVLDVEAETQKARRLGLWLSHLIHVLDVRHEDDVTGLAGAASAALTLQLA
jgi:acetolactate synthase regulatory subunit